MKLRDQLRQAVSIEGKVSKRKLFAKLLITLVSTVWVLVFLGIALSLGDPLLNYFEDQEASDTTISVVAIWFLFTVVVSAVYFIFRLYRSIIGEWTSKDANDPD